jgi:hypothetical protein
MRTGVERWASSDGVGADASSKNQPSLANRAHDVVSLVARIQPNAPGARIWPTGALEATW